MKKSLRFKVANIVLIFWCLFIGIGAIWGSVAMLLKPDGSLLQMQDLLPYFQVLPFADVLFQNYVFPGIALLCVNGIPNLIAAFLLLFHKKSGIICGGIFGVTLMAWITIQFIVFPANFLSTSYFIFGILQAITAYATYIFYQQDQFVFNINEYNHIGTNPCELVVFFSRMGYTKKIAYEIAEQSGAMIYEIKSTERVAGIPGFWWCGRFGMHRWEMPIEKTNIDLSSFDKVTICSPIWVFALSAPIRAFCKEAKGRIKSVNYVLLHHMNSNFENASNEMDNLLAIKHDKLISIQCHMGKYKKKTIK